MKPAYGSVATTSYGSQISCKQPNLFGNNAEVIIRSKMSMSRGNFTSLAQSGLSMGVFHGLPFLAHSGQNRLFCYPLSVEAQFGWR